jgi:hypothetical protein
MPYKNKKAIELLDTKQKSNQVSEYNTRKQSGPWMIQPGSGTAVGKRSCRCMPSVPATCQEAEALLNLLLVDVVRRAAGQLPVEEVVVDQRRSEAALSVVVAAQEGGMGGGMSWLAMREKRGFWEEWS